MIAVLMVVVLFVKVLERFGLLAAGYDGKETVFHVLWGGLPPPLLAAINHLLLPKFKTRVKFVGTVLTVSLSEASAAEVIIC